MKKVIALSVLVLGLAACGGDSGTTPTTATSIPTTTTTNAPPITVPPGLDNPVPAGWIESPFQPTTVDLLVMESFPLQVRLDVAGDLPTPCHEPFWTVVDDGATISDHRHRHRPRPGLHPGDRADRVLHPARRLLRCQGRHRQRRRDRVLLIGSCSPFGTLGR